MKAYQINEMPDDMSDAMDNGTVTRMLGTLAGSQRLNINLDIVPPGAYSTRFHAHTAQEEFFYILRGSGTLRTADGTQPVREGCFVAKPAGLENPHTFHNSGNEALYILDICTRDVGDVAYYPDADVYLFRGSGIALSGEGAGVDFNSEPPK